MVQLLLLAAVLLVAWMGYKRFLKEAERVSKSVRRAEKESETGASGTLVEDPKTGEYRVEDKDEES
ncbi:MAG: hypothetical protein GY789_11785 [Hyphomicrobiales bacterium]|nr:hypothetical protein [Hyphomicrobiales bacterium]MCP4999794.1 hypothetical protein [Hyphomicrobiales bacterium]